MDKKTLLLVEDEALIALATQDKLEKYGYNVLTAIKGKSAVELSEKNDDIDLILMDIDLGRGMDGTEAAELILQNHNIPIVFLSSHMEPEVVEKTEKITSYGYVVKSSSITVLDASIKMAFKLFDAKISELEKRDKLGQSEARMKALSEASFEAIFLSENGICIDQNQMAETMFGYTRAEAVGRSAIEWVVPEEQDLVKNNIQEGYEKPYEVTALRKDRTTFPCEIQGRMTSYQKRPIRVTSLRDITEHKRIEDTLRENEERFRIIADFTVDSEYWISTEGELIYQSPSIETITGYKAQEFYENHPDLFYGIIHPDDRKKFHMNYPKSEEDKRVTVFRIITKEGSVRWIESVNRAVYSGEGKYLGIRGNSRDITVRKLAEEKIEYLLTEKETLLKEVHHRIKNNMNVMKSLLNLQAGNIDNPEAKAAFQDAISRITSMEVLYDKLYRTERYQDVSIRDYISQLIDEILGIFPNRQDINIEKQLDDFTISTKIIFPLGIIVNELLTNAMKYAFAGRDSGLIKISAVKKNNRVIFIFEDNGIGMPEVESNEEPKGFGLKLIDLLTKQIDGSYEIEGTKGTKFIIELEL